MMSEKLIVFDRAINNNLEKFTARPIDGDYDSHTFAAMRAAWDDAWEYQGKTISMLVGVLGDSYDRDYIHKLIKENPLLRRGDDE